MLHLASPRRAGSTRRRLLGLRRAPGRLALAVFRLPRRLYDGDRGWVLGRTFVLVVHVGRRTGRRHETVAMVLADDARTGEVVVRSAWGAGADWVRNLRAAPAREVRIGRDRFTPEQRFLTDDEAAGVLVAFRTRHPSRARVIAGVLGCGDLRRDEVVQTFVAERPFIAFRPHVPTSSWTEEGAP